MDASYPFVFWTLNRTARRRLSWLRHWRFASQLYTLMSETHCAADLEEPNQQQQDAKVPSALGCQTGCRKAFWQSYVFHYSGGLRLAVTGLPNPSTLAETAPAHQLSGPGRRPDSSHQQSGVPQP